MKRIFNVRSFLAFGLLFMLFASSVNARQTGTITGTVTDEETQTGLVGVSVYLDGTTMGDATDANGEFEIVAVPPGSYTLVASFIGYKRATQEVSVSANASATANFVLQSDILDMDAVVVTGVLNPVSKIESSVAISTVNSEEIAMRSPRNTADLLKAIPGFYVESSGGEGGNNLFARGIPADGSFRYVSLQEDGLPVFEDGELMFGNADLFLRVDETVDRMEGVRGGTASIYASNAPGGMINFISKTGGNTFKGLAKVSVGDYGLFRTDVNIGGPLAEDWRFNIGGFYRYDEGIRPPGFTANAGGQVKGNFTRMLDNGYIRMNFKVLDDRNIFYLPIPLTNPDDPDGINNFDPNYGTMTSLDMSYLNVPTPNGERFVKNLQDGMHPKIRSFGGEFYYQFENDWSLKNAFRNMSNDQEFNAIFSLADPMAATDFAQSLVNENAGLGATNYQYRWARTGAVVENPAQLNGNGLVANVGWWSVSLPMSNFANDLRLSKTINNHNLNLGVYHTNWKVNSVWYWHDVLAEVRGGKDDQTRALDLVLMDDAGNEVVAATDNGFSRYGSLYNGYSLDAVSNALYINDEFPISDQLRLDAGLRYEFGTVTGHVENTSSFDLGDGTTLADDAVTYGDGTFRTYEFEYDELALSFGANFKVSDAVAVFGRVSDGFRTPDDQHFVFFEQGSFKVEEVFQAEGGFKYSSPNLALFASAFGIQFENIPFSDEVVEDGEIVRAFRFANSQTIGVELEAIARFGGFRLDLTGTLQDPKYKDYDAVFVENPDESYSFSDNQVRRIPKFFFDVRPSYKVGNLRLMAGYRYFGERFVDDANNNKLPAWGAINAGATYDIGAFTVALHGNNLTNAVGLTEGNPRAGQVIGNVQNIYMARPIMGRSITSSLSYHF